MDSIVAGQPGGSADAGAPSTCGETIDLAGIMKVLPHRYPFLLLDRVVDVVPGESGIGLKNVTINEQFFQGHFPEHPVMPGVLIIEAMAQTAAVLVMRAMGSEVDGNVVYFMSIEGAKFRRPVFPGDQLRLHCSKQQRRNNIWRWKAVARVDGKPVADATYTAMITHSSRG
jgi:3-hydroxyacyl-[acyl-carrier-protein] dehydratase